jgi:hypothetical protein
VTSANCLRTPTGLCHHRLACFVRAGRACSAPRLRPVIAEPFSLVHVPGGAFTGGLRGSSCQRPRQSRACSALMAPSSVSSVGLGLKGPPPPVDTGVFSDPNKRWSSRQSLLDDVAVSTPPPLPRIRRLSIHALAPRFSFAPRSCLRRPAVRCTLVSAPPSSTRTFIC